MQRTNTAPVRGTRRANTRTSTTSRGSRDSVATTTCAAKPASTPTPISSSLLKSLDEAFKTTQNPDEISNLITDPLAQFIKMVEVTKELYERIRLRRVAFYRFGGGTPPCWNGGRTAEGVDGSILCDSPYRESWYGFQQNAKILNHWAFIGYEHRLNPNLVFPKP